MLKELKASRVEVSELKSKYHQQTPSGSGPKKTRNFMHVKIVPKQIQRINIAIIVEVRNITSIDVR